MTRNILYIRLFKLYISTVAGQVVAHVLVSSLLLGVLAWLLSLLLAEMRSVLIMACIILAALVHSLALASLTGKSTIKVTTANPLYAAISVSANIIWFFAGPKTMAERMFSLIVALVPMLMLISELWSQKQNRLDFQGYVAEAVSPDSTRFPEAKVVLVIPILIGGVLFCARTGATSKYVSSMAHLTDETVDLLVAFFEKSGLDKAQALIIGALLYAAILQKNVRYRTVCVFLVAGIPLVTFFAESPLFRLQDAALNTVFSLVIALCRRFDLLLLMDKAKELVGVAKVFSQVRDLGQKIRNIPLLEALIGDLKDEKDKRYVSAGVGVIQTCYYLAFLSVAGNYAVLVCQAAYVTVALVEIGMVMFPITEDDVVDAPRVVVVEDNSLGTADTIDVLHDLRTKLADAELASLKKKLDKAEAEKAEAEKAEADQRRGRSSKRSSNRARSKSNGARSKSGGR